MTTPYWAPLKSSWQTRLVLSYRSEPLAYAGNELKPHRSAPMDRDTYVS